VTGQAESLRFGHYVEGRHVEAVFTTRDGDARASKGLARTLEPRCSLCRSIRRWHDHGANAIRRAGEFRRDHAVRWVKLGRASSIEIVLAQMDVGGVTDEAIAALIVAAIGELCPGYCAEEHGGRIVRCVIERVSDLHVDVRNPDEPFTLENIGILCDSCNPAKRNMSWATFVYRRRAMLQTWQTAIDNAIYRGSEQLALNLG
jgi:hypothetical protein